MKVVSFMKRLLRLIVLVTSLTVFHVSPASGDSLQDSAYISGVRGHAQGYSLSCESRSAADLAAFWGVSVSETEFLQALPRADNPEDGFVGDPSDTWGKLPPHGYGVHADPVAKTLQEFGLEAETHKDLSWDDLRAEIDAGHPVIVWVIGQMWGGTPVEYEAPDGSTSMVAAFEHTMILTGYSPDTVQVVDAYSGQYQTYLLKTFKKSWSVLGNMAVFASRNTSGNDESTSSGSSAESYTVQIGDFLVALADRFNTTWQELAQLNSVGYPYTIFPGQVLQLPGVDKQEAEAQPEPKMETTPTEPSPTVKVKNFQVCLPMVQRNHTSMRTSPNVTAPVVPGSTETVTVRNASTLVSFSKSIGADWRVLVELNGLRPPYLVYPGQVLKLR
jgi:uncharacterized protein YvpB/LysM repeat protein